LGGDELGCRKFRLGWPFITTLPKESARSKERVIGCQTTTKWDHKGTTKLKTGASIEKRLESKFGEKR